MEQELLKIKADQDIILDHVPAMVFFKDTENRFLRVNKAFADFMGVKKTEIEGKSTFDFYSKVQADSQWRDDKEVMVTGKPKKNIFISIEINKKIHDLQMEKVPYLDIQGTIVGVICFATDITESKHLEKVLNDSEIRFRRLFESAQDGILILEAETGQIIEVNQYLIDMLGYTHKEFLKKKLWEVGAFVDTNKSKDAFKTTKEKGYVTYEDMPLQTKSKEFINVEFVSNLYMMGDKKVIQCNVRNITERKNLEAVRDSKKLFKEEKEKVEFIAEANHELRTPLAIIKGNIDLLLMKSSKKRDAHVDSALHDMNEEVKHLINILSDLSLLTTHNSDVHNRFIKSKIDLDVLVGSIIKRCNVIAKEKKITLSKKSSIISIMGDAEYLGKLLINLVKNSIFYGKEGGWVRIETLSKKDEIQIRVSDNGIGINAENLPKVFSRFYRVDKKYISDERTTGLGLAIVKRITEAHGGKITVESPGLNKGSVFTVSFPKKDILITSKKRNLVV